MVSLVELTPAFLKHVKREGNTIDAYALLIVVTASPRKGEAKEILSQKSIECVELRDYSSYRFFGRKCLSPALTARGFCVLLLSLGGEVVFNSCQVVGSYMGLGDEEVQTLWDELTSETEGETVTEEATTNFLRVQQQEHARHMLSMEKCTASLQALLLMSQLDQVKGKVGPELQKR